MERSGLRYEHFCLKIVKNRRAQKKFFFFADFAGLFQWGGYIMTWGGYIEIWGGYITTWGGYIEIWGGYITTWGGYIEIWGGYIWCGYWGILGPPSYGISATIRIGREIQCLPYAGFLNTDRNASTKKFRIEIWTFSFQICFWNQLTTSGSGQTENTQISTFAYFQFDHFQKSKIETESRFKMKMSIFLF